MSQVWAQESQTIVASKDNTLIESSTGEFSNGMGSSVFVGRTNQNSDSIRRGLIAFDIVDQIPAGSTITEVKLTLNLERTPSDNESVELHRVLSDWGEGSSSSKGGRGAAAANGDATWINTFYDQDSWSESGGDFASELSAVQKVGDVGTYTWGSTPEMVQDVQQWLDSPETNFGWLLLGNETNSGTVKVFASRHNTDSSIQPQLSVSFES
ncbi:MAG: DNRLRE domain-containing protein [Cyanobacteria bacterium P01_A01_bin.40]